jgi:hypothetical protein
MEMVDFTQAEFRYVDFDGVDLSTCLLPLDDSHLIVPNQHRVFCKARKIVSEEWSEPDRTTGMSILDALYLGVEHMHGRTESPEREQQPIEVVNRKDYHDCHGSLGDQLFDLIRSIVVTMREDS